MTTESEHDEWRRSVLRVCREKRYFNGIPFRTVDVVLRAYESVLSEFFDLEKEKAFHLATESLVVACPNCGEYGEEAKYRVLSRSAMQRAKGVVVEGRVSAMILKGQCPMCGGRELDVFLRPPKEFDFRKLFLRPVDCSGCGATVESLETDSQFGLCEACFSGEPGRMARKAQEHDRIRSIYETCPLRHWIDNRRAATRVCCLQLCVPVVGLVVLALWFRFDRGEGKLTAGVVAYVASSLAVAMLIMRVWASRRKKFAERLHELEESVEMDKEHLAKVLRDRLQRTYWYFEDVLLLLVVLLAFAALTLSL